MKTSLAIVLAVAALTIGTASVAPISSTAFAGADPTGGAGQSCAHRSSLTTSPFSAANLNDAWCWVTPRTTLLKCPLWVTC